MTTTRASARRNEEDNLDQEVSPQALSDPLEQNITNVEIKSDFQLLAQVMMEQANREVAAPVNPNMGTAASRMRDFIKMNPPEFYGSKVEKDPQEFIDEVYKVLAI
uniref:Cen12_3 n=1 Tax=Solanum tuberosum TaxID=4113 RepID=M1E137_SOLTU